MEEDKRLFGILRPYCVRLSQLALAPNELFDTSSQQVVNALKDLHENFEANVDENAVLSSQLADYIFVPLSYLLKKAELGDHQAELLLKILSLIIKHSWTAPGSAPYVLTKQLFPLITFLTGGSPQVKDNTEINKKSDELKLAGTLTLKALFRSLVKQKDHKVYDFFSNVENLPALGHSVTVLLEFANNGKSNDLQIEAIRTLQILYFQVIADGEILSYILPGNVSTLTKMISAPGVKVHFSVLVDAIQLLRNLLVLVYNDVDLEADLNELNSIEEILEDLDLDTVLIREDSFRKVHRTNSWLKATSSQVRLALINIKKIAGQQKLEVKKALLACAKAILTDCIYSLNSSIPTIVELLAVLSNDPRLEMDTKSLTYYGSDQTPKKALLLKNAVSEEFNTSIDKLLSVLSSSNEQKKLETIGALHFTTRHTYNEFLVMKLIRSVAEELADQLKKLKVKKSIVSIGMDMSDLMLIAKDAANIDRNTKELYNFGKIFTEEVEIKLGNLFQVVGAQADPSSIVEELLENESCSLTEKSANLWISGHLLQGFSSSKKQDAIVGEFLGFEDFEVSDSETANSKSLIPTDSLYLLLEYSKTLHDQVSEEDPTDEIIRADSISIDTIGKVAHILGKDFEPELIDYLYPVIDSLASSSEVVRRHALNTSFIIADILYHGSLFDMVLFNADYLVDAISLRLSNAMTKRTTAILTVCTKIAGYQIVESFKDVLEIIFSLLDQYHGYDDLCYQFFLFFEILVDEITKVYLSDQGNKKIEFYDSSSTYSPWQMTSCEQLLDLLDKSNRQIYARKEEEDDDIEGEIGNDRVIKDSGGFHGEADSDDEDKDSKDENNLEHPVGEWGSSVPQHAYKLIQQVIYYGDRLLTHPSIKVRLQILRVYKKAFPIFATAPDNLYPIIAQVWIILIRLLDSDDLRVIMNTALVLSDILQFSGGFTAKRFSDLWPLLKNNRFLRNARTTFSDQKSIVLPGIELKCYESLVKMLVSGLTSSGRYIPDVIVEEIMKSCVPLIPDIEIFGINADIAWGVKSEIHDHQVDKDDVPNDVIDDDGTAYSFIQCF